MKVAIIGTGNVGSAIGGTLVRAGHDVVFAARDQDEVQRIAEIVGAEAAASPAAAVNAADVAILAIPWGAVDEVTSDIRDASDDTVIVDVTNPLTSDYSALATSGGPSAGETVAQRLPRAHVVKALNTLFGSVQANPAALGTTVDAFYATDDPIARERIAELLSSIGFRPVNVGGLAAARELEALAFLNIRLQMLTGGDWRSAFVLQGAPASATDAPVLSGAAR
jgi:8-hydroxy-5-deazaflavin:NADPH oxidoreductase